MMSKGRLLGLSVGPGDPELITVKALRLLRGAPVVAYFVAKAKASKGQGGNAFGIVAEHLDPGLLKQRGYEIARSLGDESALWAAPPGNGCSHGFALHCRSGHALSIVPHPGAD